MRRPSDRGELWRRWRERVAGVRPRDWHLEEPECGYYMAKRRGQWAAIQIDVEQDIDEETGELINPERFVAWIGPDYFAGEYVFEIWQRCGARPLSETEFKRVAATPRIDDLGRNAIT